MNTAIDYKLASEFNYDFIDEILRIDEAVYDECWRGTKESLTARFNANRESYILACEGQKIVGYTCFFPIAEELSNRMQTEEKAFDDDIEATDILPEYPKDAVADVFIISTAVLPAYQGEGIIKQLKIEFLKFLSDKINAGTKIPYILFCRLKPDGTLNFRKYKFNDYKMFEEQ